jgi:hypothetical protein
MHPSRLLLACFLALAVLSSGSAVRAGERYYVLFFGSQSEPYRPKYTHTWLALVKATGEGDDYSKYQLEVSTISWLPATGNVRPLNPVPERGANFDLYTTINLVLKHSEEILQWGPYEISERLYGRAQEKVALLESGEIRYRAVDGFQRGSTISNCFHAISDLDRIQGRRHYPLTEAGEDVTYSIVKTLEERGGILGRGTDHSWIFRRLELDHYPITHRRLRDGSP